MKPSRFIVGVWVVPRILNKEEVQTITEVVRLTFEQLGIYLGATIYPCFYGNTLVIYAEANPLEDLILPIN